MSPVPLRTAFWYWLKLGFISFGGPAGQIAMMHAELVERRRWISERRFLHALNYCMLLPGPEATQLAIYIGWLMHRTPGGIVAGVLFVLPSVALLIGLSWIYLVYGNTALVSGILFGVKPAVVALVLAAAWRIGSRTLRNPALIGIALAAFVAIAFADIAFPLIVLSAAVAGAAGGRLRPDWFHPGGAHSAAQISYGPALIDDATPTPPHARFTWPRLARSTAIGLVLCALSWVLLATAFGPATTLPQMGWFFTKAALMTFGGAYAVLPYVYQGAVDHFHWLTGAQMVDGLALGETTPGPLIMIVAFVGFVGGWTHQAFGPDALALGGMAGACVAAWFTFLPSFVFILAGGPFVEATRGDIRLAAPLTAISAAVVGVIGSLALVLGRHVLIGHGVWPALIAAGAAVALIRYKIGTIPLLGACSVIGLLARHAG